MTDTFLQVTGFDPLQITAPNGAPGPAGTNGVGVASATINGSGHLILTMTDGSTIDAGLVTGGGGGAVASVNTKTGVVVLTADDIGDGVTNKAYSATDKTKLAGIAPGATANSTDAQLRDRATHTGTQSADTLTDGTTNKAFLATERTKLAAITGTNTGDQTITLTGDVTGTGTGSFATALKATGTAGTYGDATHVPQFTTDGQGRITGVTSVLITAGGSSGSVWATPLVSGAYTTVPGLQIQQAGTGFVVDGQLRVRRWQFANAGTINQFYLQLSGSGTTGVAKVRFVIYADSGGYPGALILDTGQVAADSNPALATVSQALSAQTDYWIGYIFQGAPATNPILDGASSVSGYQTVPSANRSRLDGGRATATIQGYAATGYTGTTAAPSTFPASQTPDTGAFPYLLAVKAV
jgi:hypothetical protein